VLELMIYDQVLDVRSSEKLHFAITPAVIGVPSHGNVVAKSPTQIHAGAAPDSSVIGMTGKGAGFPVIAQYGAFTKVKLAGNKVGFLPTDSVSQGGNDSGTYTAQWNSTPPTIALNVKTLETTGETYRLAGTVSDDTHVEDVYVFVSNQTAKIESRKVFYRSNRSGKDGKVLDFTADLPLWPGSNVVTVVARENAEVGSMKTMFVYRGSPRTALTP
jgi:carboxyl-terminal processing protease